MNVTLFFEEILKEVTPNSLTLFLCGDVMTGRGNEQYRGELTLMYFPEADAVSGKLISLRMVPMQIRNFRLHYASPKEAAWLADVMGSLPFPPAGGGFPDQTKQIGLTGKEMATGVLTFYTVGNKRAKVPFSPPVHARAHS